MKHILAWMLAVVLAAGAMGTTASANSWGLKGKLLTAVSRVDTWNSYSTVCSQAGDAAVMGSRYHNALMVLEDGALQVYTRAVYQPGEAPGRASLAWKDGQLILSYGKSEQYVFQQADGYGLVSAQIGELSLTGYRRDGYMRYLASDGEAEAILGGEIRLQDFNIELMPRSVEEIRHLNLMHAALDSGEDVLGWWGDGDPWGERLSGVGKKTAPVYSAPFGQEAWRAAKGKAAVGLAGELWRLRYVTNARGERYACIRYNVSERTQRIGYVRADVLGESASGEPATELIHVPVQARTDTYLTDDPDVSQYPQLSVPQGTQLTCIGVYGQAYAYVSARVRKEKLAAAGEIVWGFVPLRDLTLAAPQRQDDAALLDVMQSLDGCWYFEAGGNQAEDVLVLRADGSYLGVAGYDERDGRLLINEGRWTVTGYDSEWQLYWNAPDYELTLYDEDGSVNIKGLSVAGDGDSFSLTFWEGGGGYRRVTPEHLEAMEMYTTWFEVVDGEVQLCLDAAVTDADGTAEDALGNG